MILNHINAYKKALWKWSFGPKMMIFDENHDYVRIFYRCRNFYSKIIFLESLDHELHFSYTSFPLKVKTMGPTQLWSYPSKHVFLVIFTQKCLPASLRKFWNFFAQKTLSFDPNVLNDSKHILESCFGPKTIFIIDQTKSYIDRRK